MFIKLGLKWIQVRVFERVKTEMTWPKFQVTNTICHAEI